MFAGAFGETIVQTTGVITKLLKILDTLGKWEQVQHKILTLKWHINLSSMEGKSCISNLQMLHNHAFDSFSLLAFLLHFQNLYIKFQLIRAFIWMKNDISINSIANKNSVCLSPVAIFLSSVIPWRKTVGNGSTPKSL